MVANENSKSSRIGKLYIYKSGCFILADYISMALFFSVDWQKVILFIQSPKWYYLFNCESHRSFYSRESRSRVMSRRLVYWIDGRSKIREKFREILDPYHISTVCARSRRQSFVQLAKHVYRVAKCRLCFRSRPVTRSVQTGRAFARFWEWSSQSNSRQLISLFAARHADTLQTRRYTCRETLIARALWERELCHADRVTAANNRT